MYNSRDNQMLTTWCDLYMINNNSAGPDLFTGLKTNQPTNQTSPSLKWKQTFELMYMSAFSSSFSLAFLLARLSEMIDCMSFKVSYQIFYLLNWNTSSIEIRCWVESSKILQSRCFQNTWSFVPLLWHSVWATKSKEGILIHFWLYIKNVYWI